MKLKNPYIRKDLIESLLDLSDVELQKRRWIGLEGRFGSFHDVDVGLDFIWNSSEPLDDEIGVTLYDQEEVEALLHLTRITSLIPDRIWKKGADEDLLCHPAWPQVVSAAKAAYLLLCRNDKQHLGRWKWV